MKLSWTTGLDVALTKEIKGDFKSSHLVRKRLIKMLDDKYDEMERASLNVANYGTANWVYLQADLVGYKRALRYVQSLLDEKED